MSQENGGEDALELELRARIMDLRRTIRGLERQRRVVLPMVLEPMVVALFYQMAFEESQRQRIELDTAERFYRDTYPNLLERLNLQEENDEVQEDLLDEEHLNAVIEVFHYLQQRGQLPPEIPEVPVNLVEVPPLENVQIPPPPLAIRQFPVAEAQGNPVVAPQQLGDQEFRERFLEAERHAERRAAAQINLVPPNLIRLERLARRRIENMNAAPLVREQILVRQRRVEAAAHRENQDPENFIQVIRAENRQNQDEPRQEDQEGPENQNPEEPRQEEGPENQAVPENQPQILLVIRRPAVTAPEAPVVERPAPEEQREVVGLEGQREAQPGEQPDPNVFFIPPERRVGDDGVPLPRNQDEPRQEDLEGQENRRPEEPRQ
ncbi:hypothetical protein L3Y34_019242 [Caenorhabditis briggsae]|uniref:Uncharacterized protein n=1 Tax=Caenorhabditis briggsae TaxID=6238 RepID=A0AAE9DMT2_CAEBR|nr:hypothetical protein L3Y34_019242 [Caenorhabditis briggsae]